MEIVHGKEEKTRRTLNPQVAAEEGLAEIDVFDLDLYLVYLSLGLLCSSKAAACAQEGRRRVRNYLHMHLSTTETETPKLQLSSFHQNSR